MIELPVALSGLAQFKQFIIYELELQPDGKTQKYPLNPMTCIRSDAHDPKIWIDAQTACNISQATDYGVGFVFTDNDPFFVLDIDSCTLPDGNWSPTANWLCSLFPGAAIEISQSGDGLHVIGKANFIVPSDKRKKKNMEHHFELYSTKRFIALTGNNVKGDVNVDCSHGANWLAETYLKKQDMDDINWSDSPVPEWSGHEDDFALIDAAMKSKSANSVFGAGVSFADLWTGNIDKLSEAYPHHTGVGFDHSSADAALCQHLAFWTGKNAARIDRLFRMSALMREKWGSRPDYIKDTVSGSCGLCRDVHSAIKKTEQLPDQTTHQTPDYVIPPPVSDNNLVPVDPVGTFATFAKTGLQVMTTGQQEGYFAGCVYVIADHKVLIPNGNLVDGARFNVLYGGYEFSMDYANQKVTKKAFECFTESRGINFPKADSTCFRPEHPPGAAINQGGDTLVNAYKPINIEMIEGDVTPMLDHIKRLFPDELEQRILLNYMAAVVQYIGTKFQWCPVIQGAEGNGKTLLATTVTYAVGERYSHSPKASELGNSGSVFNGWLENKCFISIEEIHMGKKRDLAEGMKEMITNSRIEGQGKGSNQKMMDNRANFMMFSNHKDAVIKHRTDRRYCVMYSAQQSVEDLIKDGYLDQNEEATNMIKNVYDWCKYDKGFAKFAYFLKHFQIEEKYNPATHCHRAPKTNSTAEAMFMSLGGAEHEVLEAVETCRQGFCGGFVSSMALANLLQEHRYELKIPNNKRKEFMAELGYVYHPALRDGRMNSVSIVDGGKPRLFVHQHSPMIRITTPAEVAQEYLNANDNPNQVDYASQAFRNHVQ